MVRYLEIVDSYFAFFGDMYGGLREFYAKTVDVDFSTYRLAFDFTKLAFFRAQILMVQNADF